MGFIFGPCHHPAGVEGMGWMEGIVILCSCESRLSLVLIDMLHHIFMISNKVILLAGLNNVTLPSPSSHPIPSPSTGKRN